MNAQAVYYFSNYILYLMLCFAVDLLCEKRFKTLPNVLLNMALGAVYLYATTRLQQFSVLRLAFGVVFFVLIMELLHRGRWVYTLLASLAMLAAMNLSEVIFMLMVPRDAALSGALQNENPIAVYASYLFVNAVLLTIVVVLMKVFGKDMRYDKANKLWLFYPVFPICQIITVSIFVTSYSNGSSILQRALVVIILYVLSDIVLYFTILTASKNSMLKARTAMMEDQIAAQETYYKELTDSYENNRKIRHDIDNHLYTIQALLADGKHDEAKLYAQQVTEAGSNKGLFINCRNTVVASYLSKRKADLEMRGIKFITEINIPQGLNITNPDLICVFGNLLDNAQEACEKTSDATITLIAAYNAPYLSISCENTLPQENTKQKNRRFPELERGLGTVILQNMAKRYDGQFNASPENNVFKAEIILKEVKKDVTDSNM